MCSEYVQSVFRLCQDWLSRLVVKIVVIVSSSASSVSVFGIFFLLIIQSEMSTVHTVHAKVTLLFDLTIDSHLGYTSHPSNLSQELKQTV